MNCVFLDVKGKCTALTKKNCKDCKFFKTPERNLVDLNKVQDYMYEHNVERIVENGIVKFKSIDNHIPHID